MRSTKQNDRLEIFDMARTLDEIRREQQAIFDDFLIKHRHAYQQEIEDIQQLPISSEKRRQMSQQARKIMLQAVKLARDQYRLTILNCIQEMPELWQGRGAADEILERQKNEADFAGLGVGKTRHGTEVLNDFPSMS